jgi:hypothetical protein
MLGIILKCVELDVTFNLLSLFIVYQSKVSWKFDKVTIRKYYHDNDTIKKLCCSDKDIEEGHVDG